MKRITAVILLALMTMLVFTGCKREGDMIETMVSSIFSTDAPTQNNSGTESNGQVTDSDGHIGNEPTDNSASDNNASNTTEAPKTTDNSIM
ncbi:MAG: hypothetical protein IJD93_08415 [Ruminococcus sp.]|nr:hypothetical protein [Ruminococcus sp.]